MTSTISNNQFQATIPNSRCAICNGPFFWKSHSPIYRCYVCTTPASDRMIQDWVDLRTDDEKLKFQFRWPGRWDETWEEYLGRVLPEVGGGAPGESSEAVGGRGTATSHKGSGEVRRRDPGAQLPPAPDFDSLPGDRLFLGRDRTGVSGAVGGLKWFPNVREFMGYGAWPVIQPSGGAV